MTETVETRYRHRDTCRLCGSRDLACVLKLVPTPPANAFVPKSQLSVEQPRIPLDVWFCRDCTHVQLLDIVDPEYLFGNYVYVSGTSPVFVAHFQSYADVMRRRLGLKDGDLVVDIGSNDGTLLRCFQSGGQRVLGIDPARDIARRATEAGIETLPTFFTPGLAKKISAERGKARLITANNVFAHVDDLAGIVEGVRQLLAPDGLFTFEVSYLADVYEKTLFDTIYHEHVDYHSVKPLIGFFERNGMELVDAERIESHGGSLRGFAQVAGGSHKVSPGVAALVAQEAAIGLDREETLLDYGRRIDDLGTRLGALLRRLKTEGKKIAGFGAPAKATTLMYHFGLGRETLDFIIDDSPLKQGLYSPGLHVPVLPASAIETHHPDYLLILAWNFAAPIMAKQQRFRDGGGHFIVPLPDLEVH